MLSLSWSVQAENGMCVLSVGALIEAMGRLRGVVKDWSNGTCK